MKPLLLVDVDGVLNPFPDLPPGFEEHDLFPEDREPVRLARVHGTWLGELAQVYDLAWVTGWGLDANRLLCPFFGLPPCATVELPPIPFDPSEKLPAVAAFVGARAAAWIDDALTPEAHAWARARTAPTLLVPVDSAAGLTRVHVDALLLWSRRQTGLRDGPDVAVGGTADNR